MKLILFTKRQKMTSMEELADKGKEWGVDGFDLCVRDGYPVNPTNVADALPKAAETMRAAGLDISMVSAEGALVSPEDPMAEPLLRAMDAADVRLVKMGYFRFEPESLDYAAEMSRVRDIMGRWSDLAERYNVKVCYHTHAGKRMGLNASGLFHLLSGFDPRRLGAYLDTLHMVVEGEAWPTAVAIVKDYLSIVAAKDVLLTRVIKDGHGAMKMTPVGAGEGMVDWTTVFRTLRAVGFDGPVSVHAERPVPEDQQEEDTRKEIEFVRRFLPREGSDGRFAGAGSMTASRDIR